MWVVNHHVESLMKYNLFGVGDVQDIIYIVVCALFIQSFDLYACACILCFPSFSTPLLTIWGSKILSFQLLSELGCCLRYFEKENAWSLVGKTNDWSGYVFGGIVEVIGVCWNLWIKKNSRYTKDKDFVDGVLKGDWKLVNNGGRTKASDRVFDIEGWKLEKASKCSSNVDELPSMEGWLIVDENPSMKNGKMIDE